MDVLGVDACGKQGWVGIRLTDGAYAGSLVDGRLDALIERAAGVHVITVDMPLGLVESGWRAADQPRKLFSVHGTAVSSSSRRGRRGRRRSTRRPRTGARNSPATG
ncbi:DUF429 domain-containing protein [Streptomyces sp. NPDC101152]|uniref:DUF429 domain-containing protein n=1 Tax=Streptomyces sp. NPDC101152 TaxID=3366116 RepID=UPI0037F91CA7